MPRLEEQFRAVVENMAKLPGNRIARLDAVSSCCSEITRLLSIRQTRVGWKLRTGDYAGPVRLTEEEKVNNSGSGGGM
jgi:hypothetical protein